MVAVTLAFQAVGLAIGQTTSGAQPSSQVVLEPADPRQNTTMGAAAIFPIQVSLGDGALLQRRIVLDAFAPAGWLWNFTPDRFDLAPGATNNTTLVLTQPPSGVVAGDTLNFTVLARDASTNLPASERVSLFVTVLAAPPAPPPSEPIPPRLRLVAPDVSSAAGSIVEGSVTLYNDDTQTLRVSLELSGLVSWAPRFAPGEPGFRALAPGEATRVPIQATIPTGWRTGVETFDVIAAVDDFAVSPSVAWNITVLSPAAPPSGSAPPDAPPAGDGGDAATTSTGPAVEDDATPVQPGQLAGLEMTLAPDRLRIAPGESRTVDIALHNTGATALSLRLFAVTAADWPVPTMEPPTLDLAPDGSARVVMTLVGPDAPAGGSGTVRVAAIDVGGLYKEASLALTMAEAVRAPTDRSESTPAATFTSDPPGATLTATEWGVVAGLGAVGAGALALTRRPLREKLVWLAVGLYTRLAKPDVLGHDERQRLYDIIQASPGVHFHALQRQLEWNTGTLTYHLRVLERHGYVVSRRDGLYRRFYLQGAAPRKETFENAGPTGLRADVLEAIRNRHGLSQTDLALALGANKQTVNYHVKALERAGMIRVERQGRETFLYPMGAGSGGGEEQTVI